MKTTAYNGQVPGPLLRLKKNQPVTIEVTNHTDRPEVVHWHGLFTPPTRWGDRRRYAAHRAELHRPLHLQSAPRRLSLVSHAHHGDGRFHARRSTADNTAF